MCFSQHLGGEGGGKLIIINNINNIDIHCLIQNVQPSSNIDREGGMLKIYIIGFN